MSKSVLSIGLSLVSFGLMFVPGIGQALGIGMQILGLGITAAQAIGVGLMLAGSFLLGPSKPKALKTDPTDRLSATLVPTTPRKISFGHTALACDVRYQAFTGANQEYMEMIVCHASHKVAAIEQLYLENELAWTSAGGPQGRYAGGYLTVTPILEGTSSNGIAIDGTWTVHCTLTGCAYSHIKAKLTGPDDKTQSPFASGVPSRMTFIGKGAFIYDPRLDDTVEGGSGAMRADDQTTWAWDDDAARNPVLEELFYELGWKINGKLAVGKGVPPARLDLAAYAVAANMCDEPVTLADGTTTESRYRADGVVSEGDDPGAVRDNLCASMNAVLRDAGGFLSPTVLHDDLATPVTPYGRDAFDENDVMGPIQFDQTPSLNATFNIVRGRWIDPSNIALYQPVDYPEVKIASPDGIDRIDSTDFVMVQSPSQAQRLAKQRLQRNQYQGKLTFTGGPAFWGVSLGDVFSQKHSGFGWNPKLFRCAGTKINRQSGQVEIVAVEENTAIYAWDKEELPAVTPGAPVIYDPTNSPIVQGIGDGYNRYISDPAQPLVFKYDYTGVAEADEFPRDLTPKFYSSLGQITTSIQWFVQMLAGGVNTTFTVASGEVGAGTGESPALTIDSLEANICMMQIRARYAGRDYLKQLPLTKQIAAPPTNTGGGTGPQTIASKASGFTGPSSTTFGDASGAMTGTMPAGKTSATVNVNLSAMPVSGTTGSWTVETKVMRDIAGTPTQIGTTQSANSDWNAADVSGDPASFSFSIVDSGLTASAAYTWRVYVRLTSGSRVHNLTGSVTVVA